MEQQTSTCSGWTASRSDKRQRRALARLRCRARLSGKTQMAPLGWPRSSRAMSASRACSVECLSGTPIPQYRLVYFQVDRDRPPSPGPAAGAAQVERAVGRSSASASASSDRRPERLRAAAADRTERKVTATPRVRCTSRSLARPAVRLPPETTSQCAADIGPGS